jgi:hypothetical protein
MFFLRPSFAFAPLYTVLVLDFKITMWYITIGGIDGMQAATADTLQFMEGGL